MGDWENWTKLPSETFEYYLDRDGLSYMAKVTFKNKDIEQIKLIVTDQAGGIETICLHVTDLKVLDELREKLKEGGDKKL